LIIYKYIKESRIYKKNIFIKKPSFS